MDMSICIVYSNIYIFRVKKVNKKRKGKGKNKEGISYSLTQ